ncbi:ankyrin repeat domain-containing protein [Pseudobacteroides cellulosolvens]|uniref:Ankyrin repeat-containing domain-containing protein n=1 Tax=Pseudobacteroides cellulosolvens ATCC 35603 = DSM 2933 TaxID=398512 RepID=A0A0L6JQF4_9FIRM|nr:ankyrin repeat domain-containing protein [Pseudobacteroides cellulosolvens]KNY27597.1 Ankyrin repeat-containing domain-containing protein [Pseudobacteroides cellulosolvens ATCC 35603 = DSM 2933]
MRDIDRDLHKFVEAGNFKKVNELLKNGADANSIHANGYTPLMHAVRAWNCTSEQRIKTAQILINNGADPTYVAPDKYQAIILAHDFEVVSLCADAGVKIDQDLATKLMYNFSGSIKLKDFLKQLGISQTEWIESERQVYYRICDYTGNNLFQDELERAIPYLSDVFESLSNFKDYGLFRKVEPDINAEFKLYALSRINDVLLLSFQEKQREGSNIAKISLEQYIEFWQKVGLRIVDPIEFHPFLCEIYKVEEDSINNQYPKIINTRWPCLMFGDLLFSRAGVCIKASPNLIDKNTAENSTLYWSHRRNNRPRADLADDWGSNSQWGTGFRLDFWNEDILYYNVNDKENEILIDDELSEAQRTEVLKNRCFVRTPEVLDCFPYDYTVTEKYKRKE